MRKVTLVLTVIAFAAVIVGVILWIKVFPDLQRRHSTTLAAVVEEACSEYEKENPSAESTDLPTLMTVLLGNNPRAKSYLREEIKAFTNEKGELIDAWKRPYRMERVPAADPNAPERLRLQLRSAGKNGIFGDSDDLTGNLFHAN